MLIFNYPTKKELRTHVGKKLSYHETSVFGKEYLSNGRFVGTHKEVNPTWFAWVTMKNDIIVKVE